MTLAFAQPTCCRTDSKSKGRPVMLTPLGSHQKAHLRRGPVIWVASSLRQGMRSAEGVRAGAEHREARRAGVGFVFLGERHMRQWVERGVRPSGRLNSSITDMTQTAALKGHSRGFRISEYPCSSSFYWALTWATVTSPEKWGEKNRKNRTAPLKSRVLSEN